MTKANRTIKRTLYKNTRYLLEFFMYEPKIEKWNNNYSINVNPVLTLRQLNSGSYSEDFSTMQERSYRITPRNLYRTVKFFNTVLGWFYDEKMTDLYLINEEDELTFNSDYNKLYLITTKTLNETSVMKAMPTVIVFNDKRYEGIHLYINRTENLIIMTKDEIEMIIGFLKDFSFQDEVIECLTIMEYGKNNNIIDDQSGKRYSKSNKPSPFDV